MKKQFIMLAIIFIHFVSFGQSQKTKSDSSKVSYYKAYDELKNMLEGKETLNYEKAVFITENAYHNNYFNYKDFKRLIDFHASIINAYAKDVRTSYKEKYKGLRSFEQQFFKSNTDNWAIFKYITDTAFVIVDEDTYSKPPYNYTYQDPYGSDKWENTQVLYLLLSNEKQGNCYALASLFKIFSDRLKSDARLTIAPHHIYIQNRNARGDFYNVELASKSFPGDGMIQTLTYTTTTSIMNGMAQRMLSDKEAVVLNLIYLAKSYQHKYNDNISDFMLQCAELAFKYDTLSLNALLLKDEIIENRLLASMKENKITKLSKVRTNPKTKELLKSHEEQLSNLYALGYREIPKDIEHIIIDNIQHRNRGNIYKDYTPNPFASIKAKQRYATLSKGLFDEMHEDVDTIQYYHALLNTKTNKIIKLLPVETSDDYKVDPVVFAMSVDPMADKYPNISPYAYCAWNPVMMVDPNGQSYTKFVDGEGNLLFQKNDGSNAVFKLQNAPVKSSGGEAYFKFEKFENQNGVDKVTTESVKTVVSYAQEYAKNNYTKDNTTYCNWGVRFIAKSFASAAEAAGYHVEGLEYTVGSPNVIRSNFPADLTLKNDEQATNLAKSDDQNILYLSIGSHKNHVLTYTNDGNYLNIGGSHGNTIQPYHYLNNRADAKFFMLRAIKSVNLYPITITGEKIIKQ